MALVCVSLSHLMASSLTRHPQWQVSSLTASAVVTLSTIAQGNIIIFNDQYLCTGNMCDRVANCFNQQYMELNR